MKNNEASLEIVTGVFYTIFYCFLLYFTMEYFETCSLSIFSDAMVFTFLLISYCFFIVFLLFFHCYFFHKMEAPLGVWGLFPQKAKVYFSVCPLLEKVRMLRKRSALGMFNHQLAIFLKQVATKYQVGYFRIMGIIVRRVANNNIEWVIVAFQECKGIAANDANIIQPEMLDIFPYKMAASVAYIHRRNMLASP